MSAAWPPAAGAALEPVVVPVDRAAVAAYADAAGDHNPIHLDDAAARALGLPGVIAHGMLTAALVTGVVAGWAGGADAVRSARFRFAAPLVVPADAAAEVTIGATVTRVDDETGTATVAVTATAGGEALLGRSEVVVATR